MKYRFVNKKLYVSLHENKPIRRGYLEDWKGIRWGKFLTFLDHRIPEGEIKEFENKKEALNFLNDIKPSDFKKGNLKLNWCYDFDGKPIEVEGCTCKRFHWHTPSGSSLIYKK